MSVSSTYWLFSVTPENWKTSKSQKNWAVHTRRISEKVKTGDYVVLYVAGTESFCAAIKIASEWFPAAHAIWADEKEENSIIYPFQAKVEVVQEGVAEVKNLLSKISFVRNKQYWGVYVSARNVANYLKLNRVFQWLIGRHNYFHCFSFGFFNLLFSALRKYFKISSLKIW